MSLQDVEAASGANVDDAFAILTQVAAELYDSRDLYTSLRAKFENVQALKARIQNLPKLQDIDVSTTCEETLLVHLKQVKVFADKLKWTEDIDTSTVRNLINMLGTEVAAAADAQVIQRHQTTMKGALDKMHEDSVKLLHSMINSPGQIVSVAEFLLDIPNKFKRLANFWKEASV